MIELQHPFFAGADPRLLARWSAYHADHPEVYELFVRHAFLMRATGRSKYGSSTIIELIRWHEDLSRKAGDEWKINNDFVSIYSRLAMIKNPELKGFFDIRAWKSERKRSQPVQVENPDPDFPENPDPEKDDPDGWKGPLDW